MFVRALLLAVPVFAVVFVADVRAADEEHPVVKLIKSKVKDTKKPFALVVSFKVKAGSEKAFEEAFAPCLVATRKEPGCMAYVLHRDPDEANVFVMYEQFKSIAAIEEHLKAKHTETLLKTVATLTEGDAKIKVYPVHE